MIADDPGPADAKEAPARVAFGVEQSRKLGKGLRKGFLGPPSKSRQGELGGLKGDSIFAGACPNSAAVLKHPKDAGPLSRTADCNSTSLPPASAPSFASVNETASQQDPQPALQDVASLRKFVERVYTTEHPGGHLNASHLHASSGMR